MNTPSTFNLSLADYSLLQKCIDIIKEFSYLTLHAMVLYYNNENNQLLISNQDLNSLFSTYRRCERVKRMKTLQIVDWDTCKAQTRIYLGLKRKFKKRPTRSGINTLRRMRDNLIVKHFRVQDPGKLYKYTNNVKNLVNNERGVVVALKLLKTVYKSRWETVEKLICSGHFSNVDRPRAQYFMMTRGIRMPL